LGQSFGINRGTVVGGRWLFHAYAPATGAEMYSSDGTPAGTALLADLDHQSSAFALSFFGNLLGGGMADLGGTLFFRATDRASGQELWNGDGNSASTDGAGPHVGRA